MSAPLLTSTYVFLFIGMLLLICIVCYYTKRQKASKTFYQQELLRARLQIQEQNFKSVSAEIHDHIGQLLSLAKLNLNRISALHLADDGEKLFDAKELISQSITDLRSLSKTMSTDSISKIGLVKAMEIELQHLNNAGIKTVNLSVEGSIERLDEGKELILFSLFQEAIRRCSEPAGITNLQVTVLYKTESLEISITGNSIEAKNSLPGIEVNAWQNLKSRAKLIGATFNAACTPKTGTTIHIYLPLID